ncbi:MAG: decarboxylating NADP(+)-dependent phosphogluconate dehydrogenase [Spirochaetales bacterium]|nr:decarboxylating NADP(+)-dependent phosphogluconate dehydrogenase [Spirochaetales bacterium]MCF7938727.1 decarboxylating NADP(+)-dependent phosphogluconate dehydrogenase [Spirochaetales bacterium]
MARRADIGLIGLAVMGQNLVLNINDHGYCVAVYNRTVEKVDAFLKGPAAGRETILGTYSLEEFVGTLEKPRKVMLMVKAGEVVDLFIEKLLPLLEAGDVIIDGGNSNFDDTMRRSEELDQKGIRFVGTGVSGGEEGARRGPSLMPGGHSEAWPLIKPIFQDIAAKTASGEPCCDWVGTDGAGHFVKMVHNGIEYGDMQLIAESYALLRSGAGLDYSQLAETFGGWNKGDLDSYLIEITAEIMAYRDEDGNPLVEKILDSAGQKGTGKWTAINAMELGKPVTLIGEAVFARFLSAMKEERVEAEKILEGPEAFSSGSGETDGFVEDVRQALYASKIVSYAQGFMLLRGAAEQYGWKLDYGSIAMMWREGCIIRSAFLERIKDAYQRDSDLENLLLDEYFRAAVEKAQSSWRRVVSKAAERGIAVPAFMAALSFYDGYRSGRLPANLIQAQRDYFGAHTYERVDRERGDFFHTDWTGSGSGASAGTYNA